MNIIKMGLCVNNKDPKGIGRIRFKPFNDLQSDLEKSQTYEEWDKNDPFMLIPFLPLHINVIPKIQQSVKIIRYDTDKDAQNGEYIAGPFTSPHDLQNQTFIQQHRDTTFGTNIVKDIKDIYKKNGELVNKLSEGAITDLNDVSVNGNYGSDVILTENGLQLRGGFLKSKNNGKTDVLDFPILSDKISRFTLKKYPTTTELKSEPQIENVISYSDIKYIIEYELNSLISPTELKIYLYKVKKTYGNYFNSNVFNVNTNIEDPVLKQNITLININNDLTPTEVFDIDGTVTHAQSKIRDFINQFNDNKFDIALHSFNNDTTLNNELYPFYFRPTNNFKLQNITNDFIKKIEFKGRLGFGLVYDKNNVDPKTKEIKTIVNTVKEIKGSGEQTFSSLSSDKMYFMSTSINGGDKVKKIDFNSLNKYELTQENYIKNIEPNTYALVRGDILYELLVAFKDAFDSHRHNVITNPLKNNEIRKLDTLMETLKNDLLNNSIRIN